MTKKYTAQDFANARFAEHEDGDFASRLYPEDADPWFGTEERTYTDQHMAGGGGWVPVPRKPTITESDYSDISGWARNYLHRGHEGREVLARCGITIVPDPEPTDAKKLAKLIGGAINSSAWHDEHALAEYLTDNGVKVED